MKREENSLASAVDVLAGTLCGEHLPKGDLAELRRMRPDLPPAAFWRMLVGHVPEDYRRDDCQERAWMVLMRGMAVMAPVAHSRSAPLGRVLASLEVNKEATERRFWTLLRSRGEQLEDQILLMARFLASKERRLDWYGMARLLLASDEAHRDKVCRNLARTFYFQSARTEQEAE
jgi:hypothetical protein